MCNNIINCQNCGAVLHGDTCEYCGSTYSTPTSAARTPLQHSLKVASWIRFYRLYPDKFLEEWYNIRLKPLQRMWLRQFRSDLVDKFMIAERDQCKEQTKL